MFRFGIPLVAFLCFTALDGPCQVSPWLPYAEDSLRSIVIQATGEDRRFINGTLYQEAYPRSTGHPFFGNGNWTEGSLVMLGKTSDGLLLKYDILNDLLIYNHVHESGIYAVNLNKGLVEEFAIDSYRFRQLTNQEQMSPAGFYQIITTGPATYYIKWVKHYEPPSAASPGRFIQIKHSYIQVQQEIFRVKGRRGLLRALEDQKKLIRQYMRENQITVRGDNESGLRRVVDHYNRLQP
jgi:hypothetical protein